MGAIIKNVDATLVTLRNALERSSRGAREALQNGAEEIKELAVQYAPFDEGNLESAIKTRKSQDGRRNMFEVYVDEDAEGSHDRLVGDYAFEMHEGVYNLGEKSQEKANMSGLPVGRKFLERAKDELDGKIRIEVERGAKIGIGH